LEINLPVILVCWVCRRREVEASRGASFMVVSKDTGGGKEDSLAVRYHIGGIVWLGQQIGQRFR
jgi:hypothetical protein